MSLTRKPGKATASADVIPREVHNAEGENREQLAPRRSSTAGKALDQRTKLQHWREQKQLQERNKSAGKVMSTSSRRGKENSLSVTTGTAGGSTRSSISGGSTRPSTPANNVAPSRISSSTPATTGRLYAPKTRRAATATATMVTAGRERPVTTRSNFPGQKVQRAPAPATPPPSSATPPKARASRPSGVPRPSASPYRKPKDENGRATSLLHQPSESQAKRDGAGSRSLRQPSLARPRREPATATLDTKAGARGVRGGGEAKIDIDTVSGTMPEETDVRSHRRPCAGPVGSSGGGGSASVWRWAGSQIRRRTPPRTLPPAEAGGESPRENTAAVSSATGERAPRPVASRAFPSTVKKDSCVTKKTMGENVADAPPAPSVPSVVQETAGHKAKSVVGAGERPSSPVGLREGERSALMRNASSPSQRNPKADILETTSSLPRRRAINGSCVVKKQSLASNASTAKVAVPVSGTSGSLSSKSSETSLESRTGDQASKEAAGSTQEGVLPEINAAGARGSPVQKREGISRSNSLPLGALTLTPPGLRRCSRFPSLHAGSAGSRTHVSPPSTVPSLACGSSGKGLRQPRDLSRRERGGGSRGDAMSPPAGKEPFSQNDIEPTLASATLSSATAPLDDDGNRSRVEVLSPVVDDNDASRKGFRDLRSAVTSKLDETDGARTAAGRASPSPSLPIPLPLPLPLPSLLSCSSSLKSSCGGQAKQPEKGGKDMMGPGVPGEPVVLSAASPGSDENAENAREWLRRSSSDGFTFESSSDDENSGSDKEDGDGGGNECPPSLETPSGWTSFMQSFGHPYSDGNVVIDPDLVQPSSSSSQTSSRNQSSSAGSSRTSSASVEVRATEQPSLAPSSTSEPLSTAIVGAISGLVRSEIGVQTEAVPSVANVVVQVGEGRLLTEDELQEKATLVELRERLMMVSHDLEAEVFHREVVKQEQEQLRRKLVSQHEEEIERLRRTIKEKEVQHNNEKIRMRWEHAEELDAERAELEDGGAAKDKLEEFQNMREQEREFHAKELEAERERVREARGKLTDAERANREAARRIKKMEEMMRQLIEENEELRDFEEEDEAGDEKDAGDGEKEKKEEGGGEKEE